MTTFTLRAAALLLAGTLASSAQADLISTRLAARDVYWAYTGAADGSGLTLLGTDSNVFNAQDYSADVPAGSYLYVVAWTHNGEEDQAFQGSVTIGSTTVYTDATHWQSISLPSPWDGFANGVGAVPETLVQANIAGASWAMPQAVMAGSAWGNPHGGTQANWIWHDSFTPGGGDLGYVIFRTALTAGPGDENQIPEPASLALMLTALGSGVLATRRRSARRST